MLKQADATRVHANNGSSVYGWKGIVVEDLTPRLLPSAGLRMVEAVWRIWLGRHR